MGEPSERYSKHSTEDNAVSERSRSSVQYSDMVTGATRHQSSNMTTETKTNPFDKRHTHYRDNTTSSVGNTSYQHQNHLAPQDASHRESDDQMHQ